MPGDEQEAPRRPETSGDPWWRRQPERYEARERLCRYMLSFSAAICSLLVLSRDELPLQRLESTWWLYRGALLSSVASALLSFLVYLFTYRERFYWPRMEEMEEEWKEGSRFRRLYARLATWRRPVEFALYWLGFFAAPIAFIAMIVLAGAMVLATLWNP